MNIINIFLSLFICNYGQFINNVIFPIRPVYISSLIDGDHRNSIHISMNQLNLIETKNKSENHIRIQYNNYNGGGTSMNAYSHTDGYFEVYETIIGVNRLLDSVMFQCIVLHELGHAMGLGHTKYGVMAPVINYTQNYCMLSYIDYINLYNINPIHIG